ncbi:MAG: RnfABCDGE type electron transport complex subunit B [Pseudomonadales bacterium]|nr:RnfABCDGE type electron transport complex subunit B [Pseudomonadales bacterium]
MSATVVMLSLVLLCAAALLLARRRWPDDDAPLVAEIDAVLPQTQCAQCGYPGCLPYARAIAEGAPLDLCPPGGTATHAKLVELLPDRAPGIAPQTPQPLIARIDEAHCIGCFLCVPACPVDAIIGAPKFMHTVLADACTGCALCLPPCPVDCISLRQPGSA